ncbi:MAG TPA: aquaporin Z [Candidatus Nanoarchaeia archaeon]|nr:aquaporin Z [Candidatus Nanoarchaeia archaeon]
MSESSALKKYFAEMFGTFVLVFGGCGSAVIAGSKIGYYGIAFAFGLSLLVMVYAIGSISGCHINPAVSLSMLVRKKIGAKDAVLYILFQCMGAIIASGILYFIASGNPSYSIALNGLGQNGYGAASPAGYSMVSVFAAEVVLTFIFLLVIHGSTSEKVPKGFAGISIGLSLVLIHLVGIPISGTSVNPARSLGPAVIVGGTALNQLWLFWVAPIIGGVLAALVWKLFE